MKKELVCVGGCYEEGVRVADVTHQALSQTVPENGSKDKFYV